MISAFFINRPKFALVISIVITLAGLISLVQLPVAEYPSVSPPQVVVSATYPGASADVVEKTIAGPIEDAVNGVEDMTYMRSTSDNNGGYTLTVTFEIGTDPDMAVVRVQNKLAKAEAKLPSEVKQNGVTASKSTPDMLMILSLFSPDKSKDYLFLSNYMQLNIQSAIARIPGVADAFVFGGTYSMRLWLDPDKMSNLKLTSSDIMSALQEQNVQVPAGAIGAPPFDGDVQRYFTLKVLGRLNEISQFEEIILRANPDGSQILLKDVAKIELGQSDYTLMSEFNGQPAVNMAIYLTSDANALTVNAEIQEVLDSLRPSFPQGVEVQDNYNTSNYVSESIGQVKEALYEAVILVILITFLFLGSFRTTLVPSIAIPVSLIGTFLFLQMLGMTINTMTLLAMILAIGIVVDDAILVIENTDRHLKANPDLGAKQATIESMKEVTAPIVATTLVLLAVFVPISLLPGITGQMYRQLGVTISVSVLISSINALTLSPVLCSLLLKPHAKEAKWFRVFTHYFDRLTEKYNAGVAHLLRKLFIIGLLFLGLLIFIAIGFIKIPTAFVPYEDKGVFMVSIQLPDDASLSRTYAVTKKIEQIANEDKNIQSVTTVAGYSLLSGTVQSNAAISFIVMKPWDERPGFDNIVFNSLQRMNTLAQERIPEATVFAVPPPSIPGLGNVGGMELVLQDIQGASYQSLVDQVNYMIDESLASGKMATAMTTFRANVPQFFLDVDRQKAKNLGVPLSEVFATLQANFGSYYINDFNKYGQSYPVIMQADSENRKDLDNLKDFYVRSESDEMIPLVNLIHIERFFGPAVVVRYNKFRAAVINASLASGYGSSEGIELMDNLSSSLASGYKTEWTGQVFQEIKAGSAAIFGFLLAVIFIYLFLVAQYESWSIPFAIMLVVPIALAASILALWVLGMSLNLYGQLGLVLLLCMASKSAILIVEFAKHRREQGEAIETAAAEAASLRFRAINMTAISFIAGMIPLIFASGPGAFAQMSLSIPVVAGMLGALFVGTLLIPCFYVVVQRLRESIKQKLFE